MPMTSRSFVTGGTALKPQAMIMMIGAPVVAGVGLVIVSSLVSDELPNWSIAATAIVKLRDGEPLLSSSCLAQS